MLPAPIPVDDAERLAALHALGVLDTPAEPRFDRLTRLASALFDVPIALISLIDTNRQWFKSRHGLSVPQTGRDISFCGHAIMQPDPLVINDALADERFHDNPLVTGAPHIRFYAGMPLRAPTGSRIGTLCIIDTVKRQLDSDQIARLTDFASLVEDELSRQYVSHVAREREQSLALAAGAANLGAWTIDIDSNTFDPSDHWRMLFGFPTAVPLDTEAKLSRVHAEDVASARQALSAAIAGTGLYEHTHRIVLPDGAIHWIFSRGRVEFDNGRPSLLRGVSVDITQRKRDELEVEQKRKEVARLSRVAVLGELSGALAHELNQPLTSILSNAQAAQRFLQHEQVDLDELRAILQDIVDEDKRAGDVIKRLRQLFKQDAATQPGPIQQNVDVNALVMDAFSILRNDLINQGVTVKLALTVEPIVIDVDHVQLKQILINLIVNACDAMQSLAPGDRVVTLRTGLQGNDALFSVIDQGQGIPPDALEQIFDPFYSTKPRGMGLGLSICRSIIHAINGRLWAENNVDRGASLHFTVPTQQPEMR